MSIRAFTGSVLYDLLIKYTRMGKVSKNKDAREQFESRYGVSGFHSIEAETENTAMMSVCRNKKDKKIQLSLITEKTATSCCGLRK